MTQDVTNIDQRLNERLSQERAVTLKVGLGGIVIANMAEMIDFATLMSLGGIAIPDHLRGQRGACAAIILQAIEWQMSPFAVANKSYSVNNRLAYEAQLIHAVMVSRAPIVGRPKFEFTGEGQTRQCRVWAKLRGEDETVDYTTPPFKDIPIKNSPLWKADPDQQLSYYAVRAWARRHFPDVIMGVIEREEARYNAIEGEPPREVSEEKQPNPQDPKTRPSLKAKLESLADENPTDDTTPRSQDEDEDEVDETEPETETVEDEIEDNYATREGIDAETEEDEPVREQDALFERLRPAAEKGPKALKLAIGKLTEDEVLALTEITQERLDRIVSNRKAR